MILIITSVTLSVVSCKTGFRTQLYQFMPITDSEAMDDAIIGKKVLNTYIRRNIILINDTTLVYNKITGGVGCAITLKYKMNGNELVIGSDMNGRYFPDLSNERFLHSESYLINKRTNEKYYKVNIKEKIRWRN